MTKYIILLSLLALFSEVSSRLVLCQIFNRPLRMTTDPVYLRYGIQTVDLEGIRSLVLGGSTVCEDTLRFDYRGKPVEVTFCDPCHVMPQPCFNAAKPALTIVDSWYLYRSVAELKSLREIFMLNGINDARANNISDNLFDLNYRHIQFYDEAYILFSHPEIGLTTIPALFHLLLNRIQKKIYLPKENLQNLNNEEKKRFLSNGNKIKTTSTFRELTEHMIQLAGRNAQTLMIGTFPYYHPQNYTLEAFLAGKLDYAQSIFMTEMYGEPKNVLKAIESHNSIIREFKHSENKRLIILELDSLIPKNGRHFNDICHLSPKGCELLLNASDVDGFTSN